MKRRGFRVVMVFCILLFFVLLHGCATMDDVVRVKQEGDRTPSLVQPQFRGSAFILSIPSVL